MLKDLGKLAELAQPWPISFKDTERIRELIQRMKAGEFDRRKS
jgi:hypothetical protein